MRQDGFVLGIDTSNYKTSVALVEARTGTIRCDLRKLLQIKQGERGLRQSDALFQHIITLPLLLEQAFQEEMPKDLCRKETGCAAPESRQPEHGKRRKLVAIAYASRPRPIEGSYMPVFRAGEMAARSLAAAMGIPIFAFSHQEGHVEAIRSSSDFTEETPFLCYHLSGGTSELLRIRAEKIEKIGGSKDLAFGQVIDRVGVAAGIPFPAGEQMDAIAVKRQDSTTKGRLKKIPLDGLEWNLSGIETQCSRMMKDAQDQQMQELLITELFEKIADCLIRVTGQAAKQEDVKNIMFTGGVSSSRFLYRRINACFREQNIHIAFGDQKLAQDNAVGIALLGRKALLWQ